MESRNRYLFLEEEDFVFVPPKSLINQDKTNNKATKLGEFVENEMEYDKCEFYEDDEDDEDDVASVKDESLRHRPAISEIEEWAESVQALSSRGLKYDGVMFSDMDPVPLVEGLDPMPYSCFNCWKTGHYTRECPEIRMNYCINCGRRDEQVYSCPRCSRGQRRLFAEFGADWRKYSRTGKKSTAKSDKSIGARHEALLRNSTAAMKYRNTETKTMANYCEQGLIQGQACALEFNNAEPTKIHNYHQVLFDTKTSDSKVLVDCKFSLGEEVTGFRSYSIMSGKIEPIDMGKFEKKEQPVDRDYDPQCEKAKVKMREVAVQTPPRFFKSYRTRPKEGPVMIEPISKIMNDDYDEIDNRETVTIAVQTPRCFVPYFTSPSKEEYDIVKEDASLFRSDSPVSNELHTEGVDIDEKNKIPSEACESVGDQEALPKNTSNLHDGAKTEKFQVFNHFDLRNNISVNRQENWREAGEESSRRSSVWPSRVLKKPSSLIESKKSQVEPLNAQKMSRDESDNHPDVSAKEENTDDDFIINKMKDTEEKFQNDNLDYLILLEEIKYFNRRLQQDIEIKDLILKEIERILRSSNI